MNPFFQELNLIVNKIESQAMIIDVLCKEAHSTVEKAIAYFESQADSQDESTPTVSDSQVDTPRVYGYGHIGDTHIPLHEISQEEVSDMLNSDSEPNGGNSDA